MTRLMVLGLVVLGTAGMAVAVGMIGGGPAPEIDPSQAMTALALLSGSVLVIRGRRKK